MSWLHEYVILPLFEPERHRGLGARMRRLAAFDRLPEHRQREEQARLMSRMLTHAYETVPYYRQQFDASGFRPQEWRAGAEQVLPLTTRTTLREQGTAMLSSGYRVEDLQKAATGGTTSIPVPLYRDHEGLRQKVALQYHLNRLGNYRQGDRVLLVWGAERDLEYNPSWRWRLYSEGLLRRIPGPVGRVSDPVFSHFLEKLNSHRAEVIYGYAQAIHQFARYVAATGEPYHRPKAVLVTAEAITPEEHDTIERVFGCRATELYGSRELGMIAVQCTHGRTHFHPAGCMPEFIFHSKSPVGDLYRVVVTDLMNRGMPLLRYDTQDCVTLAEGPCGCGRWWPSVSSIAGRAADNFVRPDGSEVPGYAISIEMVHAAEKFQCLTDLQLVQRALDDMELRYVARPDCERQPEIDLIHEAIRRTLDMPFRFTATELSEIPRAASGKMRMCISEIPSPVASNPRQP